MNLKLQHIAHTIEYTWNVTAYFCDFAAQNKCLIVRLKNGESGVYQKQHLKNISETLQYIDVLREMVAEEGLEPLFSYPWGTRIMMKMLQLLLFNFSDLWAQKSGVLKSV